MGTLHSPRPKKDNLSINGRNPPIAHSFVDDVGDKLLEQQPKVMQELHEKFLPWLDEKAQFKVAWGGRSGSKSWAISMMLLEYGRRYPGIRIMCVRETMESIEDSAYTTLSQAIGRLKLQDYYEVTGSGIYGKQKDANGEITQFLFKGAKKDVSKLKSIEDISITWCEECQNFTYRMWEELLPGIGRNDVSMGNKMSSEVWISFNTQYEDDETYKRFIQRDYPSQIKTFINYTDLPEHWISDFTNNQITMDRKYLSKVDFDNKWLGACKVHLEGAVYENELVNSEINNTFMKSLEWDHKVPVEAFIDIGRGDACAMWFAQKVNNLFYIVDFHEQKGGWTDQFLNWIKMVEARNNFKVATIWLPHDARAKKPEHQYSIEQQMIMKEPTKQIRIVPSIHNGGEKDVIEGIDAVRSNFHLLRFDEVRCAKGIEHIRKYHWKVMEKSTGERLYSNEPAHDSHSHAADALRYLVMCLKQPTKKIKWDMGQDYGFGGQPSFGTLNMNTIGQPWMV